MHTVSSWYCTAEMTGRPGEGDQGVHLVHQGVQGAPVQLHLQVYMLREF